MIAVYVPPEIFFAALLLLICLSTLAAHLLLRARFRARLLRASALLDQPTFVFGPFGSLTHVRGSFEGAWLMISRRGVRLDGAPDVLLGRRALSWDTERFRTALREAIALRRAGSLVRGAAAGATCPYCKDAVAHGQRDGVVRCDKCDSLHHAECWQEHGGCSAHGCARVPGEGGVRSR